MNGKGKPKSKIEIAKACADILGDETSVEPQDGHFISLFLVINILVNDNK